MSQLISVCNLMNEVLSIMAKMAFIFAAYKAIQAMNIYIIRRDNK